MQEGGFRLQGKSPVKNPAKPLISIVTVTFNAEKHLAQALDSILNQDYPNVELIVVDGGSKDGTLDVIKGREKDIAYWISEKDKGIYDAMNKGLFLATGDWIGFKNADDWYENGAFSILGNWIEKENGDVFYGNSLSVIQESPLRFSPFFTNHKSLGTTPGIDHRSSFVKTDWHKKLPFDLNYKLAADLDVFYRLEKSGARFVHIPEFLAYKRFGGASDGTRILEETFAINVRYKGWPSAVFLRVSVWLKYWKWRSSNFILKVILGKEGFNRFKGRKLR
jgi:glycosyltransferase involved in cell wall biosynthesis